MGRPVAYSVQERPIRLDHLLRERRPQACCRSAYVLAVLAVLSAGTLPKDAWAGGGAGGASAQGAPGGQGGPGYDGQRGVSSGNGGGGGGGGAGGGTGGDASSPGSIGLPGRGGTSESPNGESASDFSGGGGGGGGGYNGNGSGTASIANTVRMSGGNGGAGSSARVNIGNGGGGGGAGGYGALITGSGSSTNASVLTGGNGGNGGTGAYLDPERRLMGKGGGGGDGGVGLLATGSGVTITNSGKISGGSGGEGGVGDGRGGAGGIGLLVTGSGATINNTGEISGGLGGRGFGADQQGTSGIALQFAGTSATLNNSGTIKAGGNSGGVPRGPGVVGAGLTITNSGRIEGAGGTDAIQFTGGVNRLISLPGAFYDGNIVAFSKADTIVFEGDGNATFGPSGAIGFGSFTKRGAGALELRGSAIGDAPWTLEAGTLQLAGKNVFGGGTLTSQGAILQNTGNYELSTPVVLARSTTRFDTNGFTATLQGPVSGPGGIIKFGAGTLVIASAATYAGVTSIDEGSLQLGTGGTTGSVAGLIINNGEVIINRSDDLVYTGTILGSGTLRKIGPNTLTLGSAVTHSGTTTVDEGTLNQPNGLATSIVVNKRGTLTGGGAFGSTTVNGTIDAKLETLTINGTLNLNTGSTYSLSTSRTTAGRLQVNGNAAITPGGSLMVVTPAAGSQAVARSYTVLSTTAGRTGRFSGVQVNSALVTGALRYVGNDVILDLEADDYKRLAKSAGHAALAGALNQADDTATGDMATVFGALSQTTAAQAPQVFNAISGENYSSFSSSMVQGAQLFMNNFADQTGGGAVGNRVALAEACEFACDSNPPAVWGAWGGALGGLGTIGANADTGAVTYNVGGFAVGLDRMVAPGLRLGVTTGYTTGTQWTSGFSGKGTTDTFLAGLYGSYRMDKVYLDGLVGYAYSANQMWRQISIQALQPRLAQGQTGANQFYGQIEGGYRFDLGAIGKAAADAYITPFVRLQGYTGTQNAFSETGAQSLNLNVASQTTNSLRSVIAAQLGGAIDLGWREKLALQFRLGWSHEYASTARPVTAALGGAPLLPFTTYGIAPTRDGAVVGFAANTALAEATSVYLRYEGNISGQDSAHALMAGVRLSW